VNPTIAPRSKITPRMMAIFFAFMNYLPAHHSASYTLFYTPAGL
jgi:hypothetical protein